MNRYSFLSRISPEVIRGARGVILQVYPETKALFDKWDLMTAGCAGCVKKTCSRGILMKILETHKGDRNVEALKKSLPADFVNSL